MGFMQPRTRLFGHICVMGKGLGEMNLECFGDFVQISANGKISHEREWI